MSAYTKEEVIEFIEQEDVKFIRLAFCDIYGNQKNLAILPSELERAFDQGIGFDGSAINGFTDPEHSDLFLFPIASTLTVLPWRSTSGKVVRMFCEIKRPDGSLFEKESRHILKQAVLAAREQNLEINIGTECEFYLFKTDDKGEPTKIPFDNAGYMSVAPEDKGENIRREICLTLKEMDIHPESSHHEEGPGQNEVDFRYAAPLKSADNVMNFITVVRAAAARNGLYADFSPKPLNGECGNGFHINISVKSEDGKDVFESFMAGVLSHIREMTVFLNPTAESYSRLGSGKAPTSIGWATESRTQLIRILSTRENTKRFEVRSPDPTTNPYIAFSLLIYAGLDGINSNLKLPEPSDSKSYGELLPKFWGEAADIARKSDFIRKILNDDVESFLRR
ncbi:glutamine synthetase family protein [Treponema sp.]|uniref:glutamine synthetase family protein n=1 Tax=Treponema sp. TaxID=166 RepID=UPI00298DA348|nr:glutamine synthetase family protein [Treponema sp.]MCQ2240988.1 glutamine synthetase family protein [Treponema sp.]